LPAFSAQIPGKAWFLRQVLPKTNATNVPKIANP
jgi:hypothetical protein